MKHPERASHFRSRKEELYEIPVEERVENYIALFDSMQLFDVKRGIVMHIAWTKFRRLTSKRFNKAIDEGIIKPLSITSYGMPKYSREDILVLLFAVDTYNLQNLTTEQKAHVEEARRVYKEKMEAKAKERAYPTGK